MTTGVMLLNFGEPSEPEREAVVDYLERIFFNNRDIEGETTEEEARERSRQLAERRAPALIEEYEEIGGSPLNIHAGEQADAVEAALRDRGYDVNTYLGMQFTEPFIGDAVAEAKADGVDHLIGLPIYPLCGPSTNVASLREMQEAIDDLDWDVETDEITGWHKHPGYNHLRADNIRSFADEHDLDLNGDARLVFSAHGTPQYYLEQGSRYEIYVEEFTEVVASLLGVGEYELGYQNHENRDIPWTEPDVEEVVENLDGAEQVLVEPISFMHEQSETLSELDIELREEAEAEGLEFYRAPIPHGDDRFADVMSDLVEPFVAGFDPSYYQFRQCQCRDEPGTMCLNAPMGE